MDWSTHYENVGQINLKRLIERPDEWQVILANRLQEIAGSGTILEAGCGFGVTSLLVGQHARRTLLDLEKKAIDTASSLFNVAGQQAVFMVGDLFKMPFEGESFNVVFNAGVLEHFDAVKRRDALREMFRVVSPGGTVVVALPNHYSVPYRFAYDYRKSKGLWPFPDEERIYDLKWETEILSEIDTVARETVAHKSSYYFLTKSQKLRFKILSLFSNYEGYLTILTYLKKIDPFKEG